MLRESRIPVSKPVRATLPIGDSVDASVPLSATQRATRVSPFQLTKASVWVCERCVTTVGVPAAKGADLLGGQAVPVHQRRGREGNSRRAP